MTGILYSAVQRMKNILNMNILKFFRSVKYCLTVLNGMFLVTGLLLLITGTILLIKHKEYEDLITNRFFVLPGFTIATGLLILLGSAFGFYAAMSEIFLFIAGYVGLLLVVLIFEIALTATSFNLENGVVSEIRGTMVQSMQLYHTRIDITKMWDDMHMDFECCGVGGVYDWADGLVPVSCCHIDYGTISPFECNQITAYGTGCVNVLGAWLSGNLRVLSVVALLATVLQILITAGASWYAWRSRFVEVVLES